MNLPEKVFNALLGLLLSVLALYGVFAYGKHLGKQELRADLADQVEVVDEKREAVAAPIAAKQEAAQVQIRTVTKTIIEKVPTYVKTSDCPMPAGFRVLHDAAAHGEIPDPAAIADAAAVPAQAVAGTVIENYGLYHETSERLRGLQEWVKAQESLK